MSLKRARIPKSKLRELFSLYSKGEPKAFELMKSGYSNQSYHVSTARKDYLLRFHRNGSLSDVKKEIQFLNHLDSKKFPVAPPYPDKHGTLLHPTEWGPAVLYRFIQGKMPEKNPQTCREIGKINARLNQIQVPKKWLKPNLASVQTCRDIIRRFPKARYQYKKPFRFYEKVTEKLSAPLSQSLPKAAIHGDLYPDNTIFSGNRIRSVIDFEDSCFDTRLRDLATTVNGFCFVRNRFNPKLARETIKAYHQVQPLQKKEIALFFDYLIWGAHIMLSWYLLRLMDHQSARHLDRMYFYVTRIDRLLKSDRDSFEEWVRTGLDSNSRRT